MKIVKKVMIMILLCTFIFCLTNWNQVLAYGPGDMMTTINAQAGSTTGDTSVTTPIRSIAGSVITVARLICAAVAVTMICILAMKYMSAAPGEKADIKKHAVVYIVGAIIMFGCTGILGIIQNFASGI